MLKILLNKNLRKSIKQGHPWLYRDAIKDIPSDQKVQMCKVLDSKKNVLAWGYYDPNSVIAVRVLSTSKNPPNKKYFQDLINQKINFRFCTIDFAETNAFRLLNGEGDSTPGLVCDLYNSVAVLQTDGVGPGEFWDLEMVATTLLNHEKIKAVYHKPRKKEEASLGSWGDLELFKEPILIKENNLNFYVDVLMGQKTGFFLDQRDNRNYLKQWCKDKTVVNLFSYTGGFSIYAGAGLAQSVTSVDISPKAISLASKNWESNFDNKQHDALAEDVFEFINSNEEEKFDVLIVDPPSMAHSKEQKETAIKKYISLFADCLKKVNKNGDVFFSSCTNRINFEDFNQIVHEAFSLARKTGAVLRYSGQGHDHPYLHVCPEQRYLKFMHIKLNE